MSDSDDRLPEVETPMLDVITNGAERGNHVVLYEEEVKQLAEEIERLRHPTIVRSVDPGVHWYDNTVHRAQPPFGEAQMVEVSMRAILGRASGPLEDERLQKWIDRKLWQMTAEALMVALGWEKP